MSHSNTVFHQLLQIIPRHEFRKSVEKVGGDRYVKHFTCWKQFMSLLYAQIRGKDSLRDIEISLRSQQNRLYHIGLGLVKRSTLAEANENRPHEIYEKLFYDLLDRCKDRAPKHKFRFKNPLYSLDATVIDLCLAMYPWARFRQRKGALKLHCLYDHSGALPSFVTVTEGKVHELKAIKDADIKLSPDSIIAMDRAFIDFEWLCKLEKHKVFFVTRVKSNMRYVVTGQHKAQVNKGVLRDLTIKLTTHRSSKAYPDELRLIECFDLATGEELTFLTNNFKLAAATIAGIYKARWDIELFFKWIKQNLRIKSFLGTSKNAVMTQIWVAMSYFLLLSYLKYQTKYAYSLLELQRMCGEMVFERIHMIDLLSCNRERAIRLRDPVPQPSLF